MKSRPLLMKGPLVIRSLDGRKTMTRRIFTPPSCRWEVEDGWPIHEDEYGDWHQIPCPYGVPGDRLWVREKWQYELTGGFWLAADLDLWHEGQHLSIHGLEVPSKWRPGIFMPREACRLQLEITGRRFERLSAITEADIHREGVADLTVEELLQMGATRRKLCLALGIWSGNDAHAVDIRWSMTSTIDRFRIGWDLINGHRAGCTIADDPWVWVIEDRRVP